MVTMSNWRLLLGLLCLACSGCSIPMAENALVSPADALPVPALHGMYRMTDDNAVMHIHVGQAGDEFPTGFLRIVTVSQPKMPTSKLESLSVVGFVEPVGKHYILHIPFPAMPNEKTPQVFWQQKWEPTQVGEYMLLRVSGGEEKLEVASLNADFVAHAIMDKQLDGRVTEEDGNGNGVIPVKNRKITISAQAEELRKFVAEHIDDGLFEKPFWTCTRRDP